MAADASSGPANARRAGSYDSGSVGSDPGSASDAASAAPWTGADGAPSGTVSAAAASVGVASVAVAETVPLGTDPTEPLS